MSQSTTARCLAAADHACLSHAAGLNRLEVVDLHLDRTNAPSAAASHIGCQVGRRYPLGQRDDFLGLVVSLLDAHPQHNAYGTDRVRHETELLRRVARAQPLVQLLSCQVLDRSK